MKLQTQILLIIYLSGFVTATVLTYLQTVKEFQHEYDFSKKDAFIFAMIMGFGSWFTVAGNIMVHRYNNNKGKE